MFYLKMSAATLVRPPRRESFAERAAEAARRATADEFIQGLPRGYETSGGGDPGATLRQAGMSVKVITRHERLNPGAVCNLGVASTRAPYIAWLAADCIAEPGWVSGRLREHRSGALAVTNACPPPRLITA